MKFIISCAPMFPDGTQAATRDEVVGDAARMGEAVVAWAKGLERGILDEDAQSADALDLTLSLGGES